MLDLQTLAEALDTIEAAAGTGWLEEFTHSIKNVEQWKGPRTSIDDFTSEGISPLTYIWYRGREILAMGQIQGVLRPGYWGLVAAQLGLNMEKTLARPGFTSLLHRLKEPQTCWTAMCDLSIAAGYLGLGLEVSFNTGCGYGLIVKPGVGVFCFASAPGSLWPNSGSRSLADSLVREYEGLIQSNTVCNDATLVYLEVRLAPGQEPDEVLPVLSNIMNGTLSSRQVEQVGVVLISTILEGRIGHERLRIWSEQVSAYPEQGQPWPPGFNLYLPRLTFPS